MATDSIRDSSPARRTAVGVLLALMLALAALWLAGCGGDDDSTTTAGKTTGATAASGGSAGDYKTKAQAAAAKLSKQTDALIKDMQSAQLSQSDPKWAGILNSDADLIAAAATELKALTPPPGALTSVQADLSKAADRLAEGSTLMKKSVETGDAAVGAQTFLALTQGKSMLADATARLK